MFFFSAGAPQYYPMDVQQCKLHVGTVDLPAAHMLFDITADSVSLADDLPELNSLFLNEYDVVNCTKVLGFFYRIDLHVFATTEKKEIAVHMLRADSKSQRKNT